MRESLQDVVDALAERLGSSVEVDDAGLRLLAASAHSGTIDPARLDALVGRRVVGPARDYVFASGAQQWREPTRLPARRDLGIEHDRIGVPLRSRYELLGFLWLVDDGTLAAEGIAESDATARELERILVRSMRVQAESDLELESLVARLVGALAGLLPGSSAFRALAVSFDAAAGDLGAESSAELIRRAVATASGAAGRERTALSVSRGEAVIVVGSRVARAGETLRPLADAIRRAASRLSPALGDGVTVGIGRPVERLAEAVVSLDQAKVARDAARSEGRATGVWGDDPAGELLLALRVPADDDALLPEVLRAAARQPAAALRTVEAVLDTAGDVAAAARAVGVHRTTAYYRVRRFEERTGLSLARGDDRLLLHVWLRARRMRPPEGAITKPA